MKYQPPKYQPLSAAELEQERTEFLERRAQRDADALKRITFHEASEDARSPWPYPRRRKDQ